MYKRQPRSVSQSGCLLAIKQHLGNLIDKWEPDEMAVERIIYVQSHQTAITMGAAKAAVVIAAAEAGLRFLKEWPFDRLDALKKAAPKTPHMMLLRGQNIVGYTLSLIHIYPSDKKKRLFLKLPQPPAVCMVKEP